MYKIGDEEKLERQEIVKECEGCLKIIIQPGLFPFTLPAKYCGLFLTPVSRWRNGKKCKWKLTSNGKVKYGPEPGDPVRSNNQKDRG